MEIEHRVTINGDTDTNFFSEVKRLGIEYIVSPLPGHDVGLVTFEIAESDPRWGSIQKMIDLYGASNLIGTFFSPEEIVNSEWNRLVPLHEWGYPQPQKQMKWIELTYENVCPKCGVGYKQKAPFLLSKEPKLGRNHFYTLYWTYTVFCKREVLDVLKTYQITGYEAWNPIIQSSNQPSSIVSQLIFPEITAPGLAEVDKNDPEVCSNCGIIKYAHHRRGKLHYRRESLGMDNDFQLTSEWFGSGGHDGFREVIVSNRLSRLILSKGWRGATLKPLELIEG